mmetsp:Transcript_51204/g.122661  ORF Transcript_51204/g.122661 Transcript_51204/m.122661 type:complete len:201 (+) Transcript_51204:454-1056(+)
MENASPVVRRKVMLLIFLLVPVSTLRMVLTFVLPLLKVRIWSPAFRSWIFFWDRSDMVILVSPSRQSANANMPNPVITRLPAAIPLETVAVVAAASAVAAAATASAAAGAATAPSKAAPLATVTIATPAPSTIQPQPRSLSACLGAVASKSSRGTGKAAANVPALNSETPFWSMVWMPDGICSSPKTSVRSASRSSSMSR